MRNALALAILLAACTGDDKTPATDSSGGTGGTGGETENQRPIADAGSDVTQASLDAVALDGRGSYDPDGDPITLTWTFDRAPDGSGVMDREAPFSTNYSSETATSFRPDVTGTYIVKLVAEDSKHKTSNPDYVVVSITDAGAPVADAGSDQDGSVGGAFTLDGSGSYDPSGLALTYAWTLSSIPDGSTAALSAGDTVTTGFTADKSGLYLASLRVSNGVATSEADTTVVTVSATNAEPPVASAGDDIEGQDCTNISLDGSGSYDPNDDALTYLWSIQTKPTGSAVTDSESFSDRTAASPTFFADIAGTYKLSLTVFDGTSWATPDVVKLTVAERTFNSEPTVEAGSETKTAAGDAECEATTYAYDCDDCEVATTTLGADASVSDGDGDPYTIVWTVVSGSAEIDDPTSLVTTVTLKDSVPTEPGACADTEYVFQLSATDCTGETATDTVTLYATCCGVAADTSSKGR